MVHRRVFVSDVQSFLHHTEATARAWESIKVGLEAWQVDGFDQIPGQELDQVRQRLLDTELLLSECIKLGELLEVLSSYMPE